MAGPAKFVAGCTCCETTCSQTFNITVKCGGSSGAVIASASVVIKDSGGNTLASGSTNGSGIYSVTANVPAPDTLTIEVTKTGYKSATSTSNTGGGDYYLAACGSAVNLSYYICPTTITLNLSTQECSTFSYTAEPTGSYSVTGDATASGSLSYPLSASATVDITGNANCNVDLTVTATYDTGYGADSPNVQTPSWSTCSGNLPVLFGATPNSTSTNQVCNGRYLPKSLEYSDDFGSCTLTWNGTNSRWEGTYTFESDFAQQFCSCPLDWYIFATDDVTVNVRLTVSSNCGATTFTILRTALRGYATEICCEDTYLEAFNTAGGGYDPPVSYSQGDSESYTCDSSSIDIEFTFGDVFKYTRTVVPFTTYNAPDGSCTTATVTGTFT